MAGEIELAATLRPVPDNFDWQPVAREPLIALMPAEHPRAATQSASSNCATRRSSCSRRFRVEPQHPDACQRATPTVAARSGRPTSSSPWSPPAWAWPSAHQADETHAGVSRGRAIPAPIGEMVQVWRRGGYLSHAAQAWRDARSTSNHDA